MLRTPFAPISFSPRTERARATALLVAAASLAACGDSGGEPGRDVAGGSVAGGSGGGPAKAPPVDMEAFHDAFEVVGSLELEETDAAMVVQPLVTVAENGHLVLAEPMEGQVNVYSADGRLQRVLGRKGEGPGEFQFPSGAQLLATGEVVAADALLRRITFFPRSHGIQRSLNGDATTGASDAQPASNEPEVETAPIPLVAQINDLGGGSYLLAGPASNDRFAPRLHIWHRPTGGLVRSFLPTAVTEEANVLAASMPATFATVQGDTIWAVWALSDTLYKFDREGQRRAAIPISLPRPVGELPALEGGVLDAREIQALFGRFTQVMAVYVLDSGEKVIIAMRTPATGSEFDMLILDSEDREVWKGQHLPRLMTARGDRFYFADPASMLPNHWLVAQRRTRSDVALRTGQPVQAGVPAGGSVAGALSSGRGLQEGDRLHLSDVGIEWGAPALVWSFDAAACLGCDMSDPAYHVRRFRQRLGQEVAIAAVAMSELGEEDRPVVELFLATQRLDAEVSIRSPGRHGQMFRDGPVHAFYVVSSDGVVRTAIPVDGHGSWRSRIDGLRLSDFAAPSRS